MSLKIFCFEGETTITNAAREPEIIDLQNFLNKMGAKVKGAGTNEIRIEGVKRLKDISYNIMPDRIEAGTFLCLSAVTGGSIELENVNPDHLTPIITKLEETGCNLEIEKSEIKNKHDDSVDSLAQAVEMIRNTSGVVSVVRRQF